MDLVERMETYVRVVESGSLAAAARARGVSVAAVSRQLATTERELGTPLILRTTRRMSVTEPGMRWYEHCIRILDEIRSARDEVRTGGEVSGQLVVSAPATLGLSLIVPRLPELRLRHPGLHVDLRLEDRPSDLVGDGIDVAMRAGLRLLDAPSLILKPVRQLRRIVVASGALLDAQGEPRRPDELSQLPCLVQLSWSGPLCRWSFERAGRTLEVEVSGALRASSPLAILELARRDQGFAWLPEEIVKSDLAAGTLSRVLPQWSSPPVDVILLYREEQRRSPRIAALLSIMEERLQ